LSFQDDIDIVVSTHGHADHLGNNNLFLKSTHIVGFSIAFKDKFFLHPFDNGTEYSIDDHVIVVPTPGHTLDSVSVRVKASNMGNGKGTSVLYQILN
jgi:glyoxylase-like metal-dependent hydrolase (beta-lactamase superfamily II)